MFFSLVSGSGDRVAKRPMAFFQAANIWVHSLHHPVFFFGKTRSHTLHRVRLKHSEHIARPLAGPCTVTLPQN
jgi:hypothetical protein